MSTGLIIGLALGGVIVLFAMLTLVPLLVYRLSASTLRARVAAVHPAGDILREDLRANFFGVESRGKMQARGLGALVLAKDGLHFYMLLPRRDLTVPLAAVRRVELVRWHLGKSVGRMLLKVHFAGEAGDDSVAWWVPGPEAWKAQIEAHSPPALKL